MKFKLLVCIFGCLLIVACGKVPETHYFTLEWQRLAEQESSGQGVLHIQDFDAADRIELDIMLLNATAQNSAAVLADYASLNGSTAQLDFGSGDILTIDDINDLFDLSNAFTFA